MLPEVPHLRGELSKALTAHTVLTETRRYNGRKQTLAGPLSLPSKQAQISWLIWYCQAKKHHVISVQICLFFFETVLSGLEPTEIYLRASAF